MLGAHQNRKALHLESSCFARKRERGASPKQGRRQPIIRGPCSSGACDVKASGVVQSKKLFLWLSLTSSWASSIKESASLKQRTTQVTEDRIIVPHHVHQQDTAYVGSTQSSEALDVLDFLGIFCGPGDCAELAIELLAASSNDVSSCTLHLAENLFFASAIRLPPPSVCWACSPWIDLPILELHLKLHRNELVDGTMQKCTWGAVAAWAVAMSRLHDFKHSRQPFLTHGRSS